MYVSALVEKLKTFFQNRFSTNGRRKHTQFEKNVRCPPIQTYRDSTERLKKSRISSRFVRQSHDAYDSRVMNYTHNSITVRTVGRPRVRRENYRTIETSRRLGYAYNI